MNTSQNSAKDKEDNTQYYDGAENTYASPTYYCPVYNCPYNPEMMDEEDDFAESGDDLYRQHGRRPRRRRRRRRRHRYGMPYSPFIFPIIFPLDFDDWDW